MEGRVILNPSAGSAQDIETLQKSLERLGTFEILQTNEKGNATKLARAALADGCTQVIAAGGDGTINEVVNGLAEDWQQAVLGIIPLGTGNDLARTLGVPADIDAAIDVLARYDTRGIDIVRVDSDATRYFINVSAGGFSGLVNEHLSEDVKETWGPLAYLRSAVKALPQIDEYDMSLYFDDDDPVKIQAYNMVVANARYVAGGIPIAPQARLDDGLMDVVVIPVLSMPKLAVLMPLILLGHHLDNEDILFRRVRSLRIDSTPGMWFNADGELVGNEPATFTMLPHTLRMIVGPEFDAQSDEDAA